MKTKIMLTFISLISAILINSTPTFASESKTYVTIANPIRGRQTWSETSISILDKQIAYTENAQLPATYLLQYDALRDEEIIDRIKKISAKNEIGIFMEVSEQLARDAHVPYLRGNGDWARPDKVFLDGYTLAQRVLLIDQMMSQFQKSFGKTSVSVGAWYIDGFSLKYLSRKYQVTGALTCADQYSTDKYHTWGKYWGVPFYPSRFNTLIPAQKQENKLGVVTIQWALRDPIDGFGKDVSASTNSLQANDYSYTPDKRTTNYFIDLFQIYSARNGNKFGQVTVGLEAGSERKYIEEYGNQIAYISKELKRGAVSVVTMDTFSRWYRNTFPALSPPYSIFSTDKQNDIPFSFWYMSPWFRVNIIQRGQTVLLRDLRIYDDEFTERDSIFADKRQVFFRTAPATIDGLVLHNERILFDHVESIEMAREENSTKLHIIQNYGEKVIELSEKSLLSDGVAIVGPDTIKQKGSFFHPYLISLLQYLEIVQEKLALLLYSEIEGRKILGLAVTSDRLLGIKTNPIQIGIFTYPYEVLSYFRRFPKSFVNARFQSSALKQAEMAVSNCDTCTTIPRELLGLEEIGQKEKSGSLRILENSEYSVWKDRL